MATVGHRETTGQCGIHVGRRLLDHGPSARALPFNNLAKRALFRGTEGPEPSQQEVSRHVFGKAMIAHTR